MPRAWYEVTSTEALDSGDMPAHSASLTIETVEQFHTANLAIVVHIHQLQSKLHWQCHMEADSKCHE